MIYYSHYISSIHYHLVNRTYEVHDKITQCHSSVGSKPILGATLLMFMPFINSFLYLSGQTAHYYSA